MHFLRKVGTRKRRREIMIIHPNPPPYVVLWTTNPPAVYGSLDVAEDARLWKTRRNIQTLASSVTRNASQRGSIESRTLLVERPRLKTKNLTRLRKVFHTTPRNVSHPLQLSCSCYFGNSQTCSKLALTGRTVRSSMSLMSEGYDR